MMPQLASLIEMSRSIAGDDDDLHKSGALTEATLVEIARLNSLVPFDVTLETGSGKSTLLFSQISRDHTAFTLGPGEEYDDCSYTCTIRSYWFNPDVVSFVFGPTQKTLGDFEFSKYYDVVLIDGPHAFPFAAMEYFYIYPHIKKGGFLVLDDIHIPTVNHIYRILNNDKMFELYKVVETTAFYRRTQCDTFCSTADGWWLQGYNQKYFPIPIIRQSPHYGIQQSRSYAVYRLLFPSRAAAVLAFSTRRLITRARGLLNGWSRQHNGSNR